MLDKTEIRIISYDLKYPEKSMDPKSSIHIKKDTKIKNKFSALSFCFSDRSFLKIKVLNDRLLNPFNFSQTFHTTV